MEIKYNVTGKKRKELVNLIANFTGCEPIYKGTPTFAYEADYFTIDKNGTLSFDDRADSEEIERLVEMLYGNRFIAENDEEIDKIEVMIYDGSSDEPEEFSIGINIDEITDTGFFETAFDNLCEIVSQRQPLFQKSLGTTAELKTECKENTLWFDWFDRILTAEQIEIYTTFLKALYSFAEKAKRVNESHIKFDNEKFAMRTFLNRIGLSGAEHKQLRKVMLQNLTGNSAFRYGNPNNGNGGEK